MDTASGSLSAPGTSSFPQEQGRLSLAFQEPLTVAARVRQNRVRAPDPGEFRHHVRQLLAQADAVIRQTGYPADFPKLATYAVVALLDETILNTPGPLRSEWVGYPLQQELFGENVAGENFFLQLRDLLGRSETQEVAEILELYLLCLLMGFRGRYAASDGGEIQGLITATSQKVHRIRGGAAPFAPQAQLPRGETIPERRDPWIPRLVRALVISAVVVVVLYVGYRLLLHPGTAEARELAERLMG